MSVCLLPYCGLAGWDRPSGWRACHGPVSAAVTHHCGSVGLMRSSNRMTNGCRETGTGRGGDEKRKMRRKRTQVAGKIKLDLWGFVRLCRASNGNEGKYQRFMSVDWNVSFSKLWLSISACWTLIKWYNYCALGRRHSLVFFLRVIRKFPAKYPSK